MEYRKEEHSSHKTCRYYIKGECLFSSDECWYLHENTNTEEESNAQKDETCFGCQKTFPTKYDLMDHKKKSQPCKTPCSKFQAGNCDRSSQNCSFKHILINNPGTNAWTNNMSTVQSSVQQQGFYQPLPVTPPDQSALMTALNMLTQRLVTLENRMFPQLS